jgi:hypothetical protein
MTEPFLVRTTRPADLLAIETQAAQRFADLRALVPFEAEQALTAYLQAYSWTLDSDGTPLMCIGVVPRWAGVASCWGIFSEDALGHPVRVARFARDGIEAAETRLELRRIETTAPTFHFAAQRWLRHLGFQNEGIARKYGIDGSDHFYYARVH